MFKGEGKAEEKVVEIPCTASVDETAILASAVFGESLPEVFRGDVKIAGVDLFADYFEPDSVFTLKPAMLDIWFLGTRELRPEAEPAR
jgi:hypothetical protein